MGMSVMIRIESKSPYCLCEAEMTESQFFEIWRMVEREGVSLEDWFMRSARMMTEIGQEMEGMFGDDEDAEGEAVYARWAREAPAAKFITCC